MGKSSEIGKEHVLMVYEALKNNTEHPTADYIKNAYPDILRLTNKFQTDQPDQHADLTITLSTKEQVEVNLFLVKGKAAIQPKNLGAKSFLKKYFHSEALQKSFNINLEHELKSFFQEVVRQKEELNGHETISLLRSKVKEHFPSFTNEINPLRRVFLARIRDIAFDLLKLAYNSDKGLLEETFRMLMLMDDINIISRYKGKKIYKVEPWDQQIDFNQPLYIYKKGNDTVGLRIGMDALTLRFKFESGPSTSIKLATSFENFPEERKIFHENLQSIELFEQEIKGHIQKDNSNKSNAIGKCNEAIVYYQILKTNPSVQQVEESVYREMLAKYSPIVPHDILLQIVEASVITAKKIEEYLTDKYGEYHLQSIQLVPESYIKNRLDTTDLQIILMKRGLYIEEGLSLKAVATRSTKITVKNPGAGQILGARYFDIGTLQPLVDELKVQFEQHQKDRRECLEILSAAFGKAVAEGELNKVQKGIAAILGEATKVVTIYKQNDCLILGHDKINGHIQVKPQTPSAIQTTFVLDGEQELSLRVKFSSGKEKGWSSIKFAGELGL